MKTKELQEDAEAARLAHIECKHTTEMMQVNFFIKCLVEVYSKTENQLVKVQSSKNVKTSLLQWKH